MELHCARACVRERERERETREGFVIFDKERAVGGGVLSVGACSRQNWFLESSRVFGVEREKVGSVGEEREWCHFRSYLGIESD